MTDQNQSSAKPLVASLNLGLADLVETEALLAKQDITFLQNQLKLIEQQLDTKAMPKALIAEQLVHLKDKISIPGGNEAVLHLFEALKDRLLTDNLSFSLSQETKARLESRPRRLHTHKALDSQSPTDQPEKFKIAHQSELAEFSSLVRSFDDQRRSGDTQKGYTKGKGVRARVLPLTSIIAIIITALMTSVFLGFRYFASSEQPLAFFPLDQSEAELVKLPDTPLALPSFEPIKNVGALSSLAYDLQSIPDPANKSKSIPSSSKQAHQQEGPERLAIGAQDEPAFVRELQAKPEQKAKENEIDFPPFRVSQSAPQLKAPAKVGDGHSVERFDVPRPYTAIVSTDVMPRPSYYGTSIGPLRSGEIIMVDAHIGPWVRGHLGDGRPGFVLAQDVSAGSN